MDAIYFDFAKAFDTVPRERLLLKCFARGTQGSALTWIRSFLTGRSQRIVVTSYKWDTAKQCICVIHQ